MQARYAQLLRCLQPAFACLAAGVLVALALLAGNGLFEPQDAAPDAYSAQAHCPDTQDFGDEADSESPCLPSAARVYPVTFPRTAFNAAPTPSADVAYTPDPPPPRLG